MTEPRIRRRIIVLAAVLLSAAGVAVWFYVTDRDAKSRQAEVAAAREQIALKSRGIGFVENGDFRQADDAFSTLARELPGQPLGPTNLAIGRLLAIDAVVGSDKHTPEQVQAALDGASAAIDVLLKDDPDSPLAHLLAAELASRAKDEEAHAGELAVAARLAPQDAVIQFKLYSALRYADDEAQRQRAHDALRNAAQLAPDNIFVQAEWLSAQAAAEDPPIVETLARLRQLLAPFAAGIEARARFNVLDAIDESLAAVESGDWPVVVRNTAGIGNVVRPEAPSQIDRKRVDPHLLEFIVFDFSSSFYEAADLPPLPVPAAIDVRFVQDAAQLPPINDVRALELADFNLDGNLELIVLTDSAVAVWGRDPETGEWTEQTRRDLPAGMRGVVAADLDRDDKETPRLGPQELHKCLEADVDLVVYGASGVHVLQNKLDAGTGSRTLEPAPQNEAFGELRQVLAVALADVDHDGDLDLIVSAESGMSIWSNRGDSTFDDVSGRSALPPAEFRATTIVQVDWNRDLVIDALLADETGRPAGYLENQMHGRLRFREFAPGFKLPEAVASLDVAELDGNASWDLLTVGARGIQATLTSTPDTGVIQPQRAESISGTSFARLLTLDYDNDGLLDVLAWKGDGATLFRGLPGGRFEETNGVLDVAAGQIVDCVAADLDGDGDVDLLVATAEGVAWYRNDGGNANGWIDVSLSADPQMPANASHRTNMHGIGSLLELKAGSSYQAQVVRRKTTHFGLGPSRQADVVRILWTNGIPENLIDPPPNLRKCAKQDLGGSCPYLYTWDGERFAFMTDCLWSAPIGLQFAEGVLAPSREWEYLKIPGERLKPIDGEYRLQITEELWEAAYFDRVQLIAVDHPAEIDVYTNEKVGPAAIAGHKIYTVRNPRIPAARDKHDRDVLPQIAARDDDYLKAFDGRITQGLVDEHFVELDLGELDDPRQIVLFLTGWIFPTDTSLNVAISQNPGVAPPRPPSIQVPDGNGGWVEAIPYCGFPGGKTKTIAVDVSGIFPEGDYRLRLVTSMELYWDQMFFTVDEEPEAVETIPLPLVAADLHYRGFSRRIEHPGHGPESYDYDDVETGPKWPPMAGRFTRYGDVARLLEAEDDQLVVMGAGDELTLRFRAPERPLPPGWRRDFVLYSVGWDKDADLNTVYGQTVEPLPFRAMRRYPFAPEQSAPDTPDYRQYLRTYQTRTQNAGRFWKALAE